MFLWLFVVFFSGAAGLIYQVIWVREFGQIFGNTIQSAALVSGMFIFGLGLGSFLAGRFIDSKTRRRSTAGLEYYIVAELVIGILGLITSLCIYKFEGLSPLITTYIKSHNDWYELSHLSFLYRTLILIILIGPVTVVMGATLTFLIRSIMVYSVDNAGWKVGLLYGFNTLGAALGCLLTDSWVVPAFGLMATKMIAVGLNFLACGLALLLLKRIARDSGSQTATDESICNQSVWYAGLALAISGFCAMGMELVWFRFISSLFSSNRIAFSLTLFVILVGMWFGSILGGFFSKKFSHSARFFVASQLLFAPIVIGSFLFFINSRRVYFLNFLSGPMSMNQESLIYNTAELFFFLIPALKIALLPAACMGAAYPLINGFVQQSRGNVGENAGIVYLWNAVGALGGSLFTGFILIPNLGMQNSTLVLAGGSVLAILPIVYHYWHKAANLKNIVLISIALILPLATMVYWNSRPTNFLVLNAFLQRPITANDMNIVTVSEGINETAMVVENKSRSSRSLYTNGHSMSATDASAQRYMRAFSHIPLLQTESPKSALVICFGVGNTLNAVSRHPSIEKMDLVDISYNILQLAPQFGEANQNVLSDPRVNVYVNDGRQHLRMQSENSYDLITLEPPPLKAAGVSSLYSKEFYNLAERALKPGGFITQWLPINQISGEFSRKLIKAFISSFPNAVLLNGSYMSLILVGQKEGKNEIDWKKVKQRIQQPPAKSRWNE